ncbi:bifunctional nuclease family protein [Desulfovibrio sp. OttesenSCG-928-A18]|nr:bifunctional nuclease family protein [Desulfovibrio sp. OttesenSCG-928-A18]
MVDLTVLGISLMQDDRAPVLLLYPSGTQRLISLPLEPLEAFALAAALHEGASSDLSTPMAKVLGGRLRSVELTGKEDNAFSAEAEIAMATETLRLDCRPAEGIALALRSAVPIRASKSLLKQARTLLSVLSRTSPDAGQWNRAAVADLVERFANSGKKAGRPVQAAKKTAEAKQGAKRGKAQKERPPQKVEAALAALGRFTGSDRPREVISVARKLLDEERTRREAEQRKAGADAADASQAQADARMDRLIDESEFPGRGKAQAPQQAQGDRIEVLQPGQSIQIGNKTQRVRISLVRHDQKDKNGPKLLEEITLPLTSTPMAPVLSVPPPPQEGQQDEAKEEVSEEERWAALLRILSPETKVPM